MARSSLLARYFWIGRWSKASVAPLASEQAQPAIFGFCRELRICSEATG
jgi:hypothetical protein